MPASMPSRRQEKVAHLIRRVVSETIAGHLSDPRIDGLVSVTRVQVAADLRHADVYLSIYAKNEVAERLTFDAIEHARSRIQSFVAAAIDGRFCPVVRFVRDEQFKKTVALMALIDRAAQEYRHDEPQEPGETSDAGEVSDADLPS